MFSAIDIIQIYA